MFARRFHSFLQQDYAIGVLLFIASALAMLAANTFFAEYYDLLLSTPIRFTAGPLDIHKPLLLWINDGLMAVFFLLIGLEVKREVLAGELSTPAQVMLPGIGAIGGMLVPALFYVAFNHSDPIAIKGWAIPAATDIAFAVGILALLGKRAPASLMTFLLALAIIDDLGAIIIIAIFYTEELSLMSMGIASALLAILAFFNHRDVTRIGPYMVVGVLLWICVLKSGVHATLAGVLLAFTIPLKTVDRRGRSPLKALQHNLHSSVHYVILPIFAFANAGLELNAEQIKSLFTPIPLGIVAGLFLGKQIGVFSFCWLAVKSGLAKLPTGTSWLQMYGLSILCGIGFTMSLFIGSLAFENVNTDYLVSDRIGVLAGSILSAVFGFITLYWAGRKQA
ncbi:Na+/H+ antiporter NhaA [Endozoicomonas sp. GU-1]|uniref:Na+/H+ antiporter NhaA n=1 Tax=Endozoicomonas sp. GU-1 TaxID=3009078 RepID=UPI0022B53ECA|nr:Na+/H+ antiporter NhaA [Endozoicomonas sp. GU-1]WBA83061.1 Na+/H+ antiporter NhaA [Endozoicomonas sp. GU-1]WBA85983.1 Na+/H+ antiporter NhaA [Endozoicomonas sp. GU-1]